MRTFFIFLFLPVTLALNGQVATQPFEVKDGDTLRIEKSLQYAFNDFTDGTVLFKNGTVSNAKLNYDYLAGELQFIDEKTGMVMALNSPSDVSMVSIGGRKLIYKGGSEFIEILFDGNISLGVYRKAKVVSVGKTGAYGMVSATSSITSLSNAGEMYHSLAVKEHINVSLSNAYYLITAKSKNIIKGVKTYSKTFPSSKASQIEKYVAENNIDFKNEGDLVKLTKYCDQL